MNAFSKDVMNTKMIVDVEIENAGEYVTDEVVQVYVTKKNSSVKRAIRKLKAFERVKEIKPGEKRFRHAKPHKKIY